MVGKSQVFCGEIEDYIYFLIRDTMLDVVISAFGLLREIDLEYLFCFLLKRVA